MWARGVELSVSPGANGVTLLFGIKVRSYRQIKEFSAVEIKCPKLNLDVCVTRCNHAAFSKERNGDVLTRVGDRQAYA
jgi:hypothetical protein